jgi:hypothetical protein
MIIYILFQLFSLHLFAALASIVEPFCATVVMQTFALIAMLNARQYPLLNGECGGFFRG